MRHFWILFGWLGVMASLHAQDQTVKPVNLGAGVNSPLPELNPRIAPDGKTLYFIRENKKQVGKEVKTHQNIWVSRRDAGGNWGDAVLFGDELNHPDHNSGVLSISPDGNQLLVMYHYVSPGVVKPGVSIVKKNKDGKWGKPEPQFIQNFENLSKRSSFYLSNDGNILIGEFQGADSKGNQDLYVSFRTGNNAWSAFQNLGIAINTTEFEFSPFLASDNRTLFFASSGHGGLGNADIFMTRRTDDTWTKWTKPQNLGANINSSVMDAYFSIPASGDDAYFVSSKDSKGWTDIYKVKLADELRPLPVTMVSGRVINMKDNSPVSAKIEYEILPEGKVFGTAYSGADGKYQIVLPSGVKYGIYAEADNFICEHQNLDLIRLKDYKEVLQDIGMYPLEEGQSLVLNNIFFETGKSNLKPESFPELNRLVEVMKRVFTLKVEISGHTDNVGSAAVNKKLSTERSERVANYLAEHGIDKSRIRTSGFGPDKPIADNATDEGKQKNRRVEFKILSK